MHGGAVAIFAIISMNNINKGVKNILAIYIPSFIACYLIHSIYNHFIMPPIVTTIVYFSTLTLIIVLIFLRNEISLRDWLDLEFDNEIKLLSIIKDGKFSETKAGQYIISIKKRFSSDIILDILCFIQLYLELSIRAKSILVMKENGFPVTKDSSILEKLNELKELQKRIGKAGLLAITPILKFKQKDLWKINMLEDI